MNERQVITALQQSVISAVAQSITPTLPIKFLNVTFNKPDDGKWLELIYIPAPPRDSTWGDEKIYAGILRMLVYWPNDGGGSYSAMDLTQSIMSRFSKHQLIGETLRLMQQPRLSSVIETEKSLILPISLEYSTFSR